MTSATGDQDKAGFLAPYRVLDLTDHRGLLAGHMLAQLGADVIQVEPPGGSPARSTPPFAPAWPVPDNSLYWAAYASGKRSIVCDPGAEPDLFRALVASADFLFESAAPADGRPSWLAPDTLRALNPTLVHVSITPFGLTGPKAHYADSDIVVWAAGGPLLPTRVPGDPRPVRISAPQSWLHAAGDAAGGALIAHFARLNSGQGQHVDISAHQSVPVATLSAVLAEAVGHPDYVPRPSAATAALPGRFEVTAGGARTRTAKWPMLDGLAELYVAGGPAGGPSTNALFGWMRDEGWGDPVFDTWDWTQLAAALERGSITTPDLDRAADHVSAFLATRSKHELMDAALARGIMIAPIQTMADLIASPHSAARGFFQTIEGPFGSYVLPGDFAFGPAGAFVPLRAAPRLDEHGAALRAELGGAA
ncbi:CoA transferase [Zavarzinia sp. CC-PAN008]|uniref:CoA transferase n=1 Tax=Zavarzinia sp. CC-PAN008 TaxID=3243332 RepID=UPI003F7481D0